MAEKGVANWKTSVPMVTTEMAAASSSGGASTAAAAAEQAEAPHTDSPAESTTTWRGGGGGGEPLEESRWNLSRLSMRRQRAVRVEPLEPLSALVEEWRTPPAGTHHGLQRVVRREVSHRAALTMVSLLIQPLPLHRW